MSILDKYSRFWSYGRELYVLSSGEGVLRGIFVGANPCNIS